MSEEFDAKVKKYRKKIKPAVWLMVIIVLVSLGTAIYFWKDAQDARSTTPEAIAERNQVDSERVINKLNDILLTDSKDAPTVARIENPQVLIDANPEFYKYAVQGDYLVLYPQRAIIYREADDRIINVAPIINTSQLNTPTDNSTDTDSDTTQTEN
jgi:hypothetical protein